MAFLGVGRLLKLSFVVCIVITLVSGDLQHLTSDDTDEFDDNGMFVRGLKSRAGDMGASRWGYRLPAWRRAAAPAQNSYAAGSDASDAAETMAFRRPEKRLPYGFHAIRGKRQIPADQPSE